MKVVEAIWVAMATMGMVAVADDTMVITQCDLTVTDVSPGLESGLTDLSFALSDVTFKDCDDATVSLTSASITNCGALTTNDGSALVDGDDGTQFECTWSGTNSSSDWPKIKISFQPTSISGYNLVAGALSGAATGAGNPYSWDMVCNGVNSDGPLTLNDTKVEVASALTAADNDEYTAFNEFDGLFEDSTCTIDSGNSDAAAVVSGDPFVFARDGRRRQFWLPVGGNWTEILHGPRFNLSARAFGLPDTTQQWIDGLRVADASTGDVVLSIEIPSDVPLGALGGGDANDLNFLRVSLDHQPFEHVTAEVTSRDGAVAVQAAKLAAKTIRGLPADSLWVRTLDFAFHIYVSSALKFQDPDDNDSMAHLNFKFTHLPHDGSVAGFLADVVTALDDAQLSPTTRRMLTKPDHPYPRPDFH